MKYRINWDAIGISASVACAIHCGILPLVLTSLPFFGVNLIGNSGFESFMILLAFFIGLFSLRHGYRRHRRGLTPLLFLASGFLLLFARQVWHQYELRLLPFAVILIVAAHLLNIRFSMASHADRVKPKPSPNLI